MYNVGNKKYVGTMQGIKTVLRSVWSFDDDEHTYL